MAGSGYKTFAVGEVLTAANVNGYLMDQVVMKFADSGARGSAIGTATEGMVSYLDDTDTIEVYDGSAWVEVGGGVPLGTATPVDGSMLSYSTADSVYNPTAGPMPIAWAAGTVTRTGGFPGFNTSSTTTVTFPAGRFSTPPYVVCSLGTALDGAGDKWRMGDYNAWADTTGTASFSLVRAYARGDIGGAAAEVIWYAVEFG